VKYRNYDNYVDSGIDWLKEIPDHWNQYKLKHLAIGKSTLFIDGDWIESKNIVFDKDNIRYITTGNVGEGKYKEQGHTYITEETFKELNCTEVYPGDILISRLNPPIGRACLVPNLNNRIVTSVDNVIFRPKSGFSKNFLVYFFTNPKYFDYTNLIGRGATMQRISRSILSNIKVALPPLPEQTSIAAFLDRETARIDALIDKKQQLIALLKEKRTALITRAVTRGLDANAKMKDSGIEWLGDIPEHWEVKRLKYLVDAKPIKTEDSDKQYVGLENIESWTSELINLSDFQPDGISNTFEKGDILFGKLRPYLAKATICDFSGICSTEIIVLSPIGIVGEYLLNIMLSVGFIEKVNASTYGSKMPRASWEFIGNLQIPVPNVSEQHRIVEFLGIKIDKLTELTRKNKLAIEKLREYRTALISAAVTGKIKVSDENINQNMG
jgi:type I restriction enzyme, S subunit